MVWLSSSQAREWIKSLHWNAAKAVRQGHERRQRDNRTRRSRHEGTKRGGVKPAVTLLLKSRYRYLHFSASPALGCRSGTGCHPGVPGDRHLALASTRSARTATRGLDPG